ncbi:alpha-mannosidase [Stenomitos frigidus]|uniref:alpha-mannosidase n=1 Tax=Stenomitos frigidus TaxID=1886765 RepID=UPI001FE96C12|nr:alpha-mannosidase [Stenomitos frigidus]
MIVVSNPVSAPADQLSEAITRLRSLTQTSIQEGWRYCDEDLSIAQATQPDTWQDWPIAPLNEKDHIAWAKGKHVRWLGQLITVPHDLAGYPLAGMTLRLALTWWAIDTQIFVNGALVQAGDLFDCVTRILLSEAVTTGGTFAIALRLVSPGHDDGALVRSVCHYESSNDIPEPSFIADELDILRLYLQTFAPEKLAFLTEAVTAIDWSSILLSLAPPTPHSPLPTPHSLLPFTHTLTHLRDRLLPLSPLLKQRRIRLLGHAHLDMAWLWTVDETWKAAERTFESALNLQKDFPELIFCHSTPALYAWMEQNRPALFEQIRQAIAAGWWELVGGLWIEPELNIISGESMVRQVLYGQRYFQEKFGSINRMAWLPDSFGFTWQLPQILKQGGMDYFVTQKLRWNDTTKFPYEVFKWQAPDRTEIFSLMSAPIGEGIDPIKMATYACDWETKTGIPDVLWLPGVGDHGGGPTRDMLEIARRWQQSPFFPQLEFSTALDYLQDLEANYTPDAASSVSADVSNIVNEPQNITNEPQTFNAEPQTINDLPQTFEREPQTFEREPQSINDETKSISDKAKSISHEPLSINDEPLSISAEPQNINAESQSIVSEPQNAKLFPPLPPLPPLPPTPDPTHQTPPTLPSWHSDLYLEFHRGCYTTHADQKRDNRRAETLLYRAELLTSFATLVASVPYPKVQLEAAWKQVLFNQFHDILPGSSVASVFVDANDAWNQVFADAIFLARGALEAIGQCMLLPPPPHPQAQTVMVFNSLTWERSEIVTVVAQQQPMQSQQDEELNWQVSDLEGQPINLQSCLSTNVPTTSQPKACLVSFLAENIPAIGYRSFWLYPHNQSVQNVPSVTESFVLENEFLRVTINPETGDLSSVLDKVQQREVLNGPGNQLQAFKDSGQYWDAWNIDPNYAQFPLPPAELIHISAIPQVMGTLERCVQVDRTIGQSTFRQTYSLQQGAKMLKMQTRVDWQERHTLVKVSFPLNLEADYATYEIPCGVIQRTTKPETEAEKAQWEVPAMHWADLSDGNYGVSLLNDCKYGYDVKPNQLLLTLLRGAEWPDPDADKGQHFFTYALYPHAGDWKAAQSVKHGYELNMPLMAQVIPANGDDRPQTLPPTASLLDLGADNLVLMAFKQSEDSPDEWILRCYECHGEDAQLTFHSDLGLELGERVDLLERSTDLQTTKGQTATVRPWEIASFRVSSQQSAVSQILNPKLKS